RRHSTVRNLIFGVNNGGGYPNTTQVRDLLEVERVDVAFGFINTKEENIAKSISAIWSNNVLVYYAPLTPAVDRPSFAYSMRWAAPGIPNMQAERHPYDSKRKQDDVEVGFYQDEAI